MIASMNISLVQKRSKLDLFKKNLSSNSPKVYIANEYNNIDRLKELINIKIKGRIENQKRKVR